VTTTLAGPQVAGDLNVVVVGWANTTSSVSSVTDSAGNIYQLAAPVQRSSNDSQAIYYATNVLPGPTTVTVTMSASTPYVDVRVAEYSGVDRTNPVDVTASGSGTSASPSSGAATTTAANDLIIGAGTTGGLFTAPGSGFTSRIITSPDGDILEDRIGAAAGSYTATASAQNSTWVMQMVAFRAAGQ
jgi:hypothetical protein